MLFLFLLMCTRYIAKALCLQKSNKKRYLQQRNVFIKRSFQMRILFYFYFIKGKQLSKPNWSITLLLFY